jgi:hypothetical protein
MVAPTNTGLFSIARNLCKTPSSQAHPLKKRN